MTLAAAPSKRVPRRRSLLSKAALLSPAAKIGLAVLGFWVGVAILAPAVSSFDPAELVPAGGFVHAGAENWLGTDYLGRDLWSRMAFGARSTLGLGLSATLIAFIVGVPLGFLAGLKGGRVDNLISRTNDVLLSFPAIVIALLVVAGLGASNSLLTIVTGLIYATGVFRIARACCMGVATQPFVEVARLRGEKLGWILGREILPNVAGPLLTEFGLRFAFTILFISGLSFVGLGIQPPAADWGVMVRENLTGLHLGSLAPIIPAAAIASITISLNMIVDDLGNRGATARAAQLLHR